MFDADIRDKYERARRNFDQGRFAVAESLLAEIDRTYPNSPDVVYSRARCLGELGRVQEARVLATKLQTMLNDPRARELQAWLAQLG